jgi:hypothetical protein
MARLVARAAIYRRSAGRAVANDHAVDDENIEVGGDP